MKIIDIRNYSGRNIYSHKPVVKMIVDVGDLAEIPTNAINGFNKRLLEMFPGLQSHYCSTGYEGGFCDRLKEGTFVSHVTEHLALELQYLIGYDVYFGKTRILKPPSIYCIIFEYIKKEAALECGRCSMEIVSSLADDRDIPIEQIMQELQSKAISSELGPSTRAIFNEAQKRCIPVERLGNQSLLQLGSGKYIRLIEASLPDTTSCIAVDLAKNKQLANQLLGNYNIPIPPGDVACTEEEAVSIAEQLGYPLVIKPYDGNQGKGVTTHINNEELLRSAFRLANSYTSRVMVEKQIHGKDYRILVVGNKVSAAAERKPPHIIGDGIHSIEELVDRENQHPDRGMGHEKPLTRIKLDEVSREWLDRSALNEDSIPLQGELIILRENGNLSTGGQAIDVTSNIHPENIALAVKAAQVIGLEVAGIDMMTDDISKPLMSSHGAIIEVNASPGLRMHLYPSQGKSRNVAADILDYIYPPGLPTSIPIIAITGSNGKTTVTRLINHVLTLMGKKTGMTCSSGTYIGNNCISKGDNTGPFGARMILGNREVDIGILETARGGIIKRGLGYDIADVGVIVNISEDHLGMDEIYTLKDMAFVKSLVVEAIKPEGYAVLNADDQMTTYIAERVRSNLIYFSQNSSNPIIESHLNQGKMAVIIENNKLVCCQNNHWVPLLAVEDIPITFDGKAACNIENALAAAASLLAMGISEKVIAWGLRTFKPDPWSNAGRFNLFSLGDFQVMLDYGHNLCGYEAVVSFIKRVQAERLVGVIGMPGDRSDEAIYEVGRLCGQVFSKIFIKEDRDLRKRNQGETAHLLYQGAISGGAVKDDIEIIYSEIEALDQAICHAQSGDLIVAFYEHFEEIFATVQNYISPKDNEPVFTFAENQVTNRLISNTPTQFMH